MGLDIITRLQLTSDRDSSQNFVSDNFHKVQIANFLYFLFARFFEDKTFNVTTTNKSLFACAVFALPLNGEPMESDT